MNEPARPSTALHRVDTGDVVTMCDISEKALSADAVLVAIADPACGGQVLFLGRVRDHDRDRPVARLGYESHPDATSAMREVCDRVASAHDVRRIAVVHRSGDLDIGDIAVIVGVGAAHRGAAFTAARALIDQLKAEAPIWKHQHFADGGDEWVGLP